MSRLMNSSSFAVHVIHQQILTEIVRRREVGFAAAEFRHFLHKVDQTVIASQHESIDQNALPLAAADFFQRPANHQRIETEGVLIKPPIV